MDIAKIGIYSYAMKNPKADENKEEAPYILLPIGDPDLKSATGVYHKYAQVYVDFKEFGVNGGITKEWTILDNDRDTSAKMSDGHAFSVDVFWRFKEVEYYKGFEKRVSKIYGGNSWLEFVGPNMTAKRKAALKELEEKT